MNQQETDSSRRPIILLDLNYTLVANSPAHGTAPKRMEQRLVDEQYRHWLVELVRPHTVVLMTARPETWMTKTLDHIEDQTRWRPQDACFAPIGWWNPPAIKQHLLHKRVFPRHGEHARYIAIESNPRTREMYARFSIPCFWVTAEGTYLTDGTRLIEQLHDRHQTGERSA
jgi:phosphoribosylaminoimidazole carboxylase (NCAIR synthetase)